MDYDLILRLPDEILIKILKDVPQKLKLSHACRRFYNIAADIDRCKYRLGKTYLNQEVSSQLTLKGTNQQF
jgi:hypothetical protein